MKWFMGLVTWLWSGLVVCEEEQTTDGSAGEGERWRTWSDAQRFLRALPHRHHEVSSVVFIAVSTQDVRHATHQPQPF